MIRYFDDDELNKMIINDEVYQTMPKNLQSMYLYYKIKAIEKCITFDKMKKNMLNRYKKDAEGVS